MFLEPLRPLSGAYICTRSLWFHRWRVAVGALLVVVCQTTTNNQTHLYTRTRSNEPNKRIKINQPTRCNSFTSLLLDVYVWLNMFRAPLRPSSGAYICTRSLWFHRWSVAVGTLLVVVWPDYDQQRSNRHSPTVQPEAPSTVVRSWWWAERRPKHVEPHINVK